MNLAADKILWDVESQHLDEAEFLLELREAALDAPNYTLSEIEAGPEARLLAHVDGLVLGGPAVAEQLSWPSCARESASLERAAAATLALLSGPGDGSRVHLPWLLELFDLLEEAEGAQRQGIIRGLQLCPREDLGARLVEGLSGATERGTSARLEVLAGRGHVPGPWLAPLFDREDISSARAAVTLARFGGCSSSGSSSGFVSGSVAPRKWDRFAHAEDPSLRLATLTTSLVLGLPGAWESALYWAFCPGDSPFRREALTFVAQLGDADVHGRVLALLDDRSRRADALWACCHGGRAQAVDRCLALGLLDDPHSGHLAAELVCAVAGLPPDDDSLWVEREAAGPDPALPALESDDLDADLVPEPEESLPWPEPAAIAAWWQARRGTFDPALRYHRGRPLDASVLLNALAEGPMRWAHAQAFELAARSQGKICVNTRALCGVQRGQLTRAKLLSASDCQRGFGSPPG